MKFIRLRVANYRGITEAEVRFGPTGITLVHGPNEAGKTSLGEAIGLLFEEKDSAKKRSIEAIKPVHRDEGPEIELHAESGPYVFTYFKRFLKRPETKLTVTQPKPENYTAREAHERAEAILKETLDIDLWKALTLQQGEAIHQPDLAKQTSLSAALDKAAGGNTSDPREEGLFAKVHGEYLKYYTDRGSDRKELAESGKAKESAQAEVERIQQALLDLDHDIERAVGLQQELRQLAQKESELVAEIAAYTTALGEITALEVALSKARLKLDSAQKSEGTARRDVEDRAKLIDEVGKTQKAVADVEEALEASQSAVKQAEATYQCAKQALDEADGERKAAESLATLRRADLDFFHNNLSLSQLRERRMNIVQARENAADAEKLLAQTRINSATLQAIKSAEQTLLIANAQLQIGAPRLVLRGLADCQLLVDGEETTLAKGEERTLPVAERSHLVVLPFLEMEISAGTGVEGLTDKVDKALRALEDACADAGVASPDEAQAAFEEQQAAMAMVDSRTRVEHENLRDLSFQELVAALADMEASAAEYPAKRVVEPPLAPDLAAAKAASASAETRRQESVARWDAANESLNAASIVRGELKAKNDESQIQLKLLTKTLGEASENLDRARNSVSDDELAAVLERATQLVEDLNTEAQSAGTSLEAKNPDNVKFLAETAEGSLRTAQMRRNNAQTELTQVQTRLKIHGEEGLHEKLNTALGELEHLSAQYESLMRRAAAANCLYKTLSEERDKARRAYVAPLKEKIEHLGRLVFDDSFQVEISEDLKIVSRTQRNVTVPFDSLSGGTREQLSLIFRAACAMIAARDGGAPLILDDTLGYTDPKRLGLMGAVLAKAAKECQIVIFTCVPNRYGNVGEATVVALG